MAYEGRGAVSPGQLVFSFDTPPEAYSSQPEEALWRWLENLAFESERVRREEAQTDQWDHWLDLFGGKQWPTTLPTYRPPVTANELRSIALAEASDLNDTQLRVYITKDRRSGDRDESVERAFRAVWVREQVDLKLIMASLWAEVLGTSFLRVPWDPDASEGYGDVTVDVLDPRMVLPDPDAIDDQKWLFAITDHVLDLHEIRRLFPVNGMRVQAEDRWSVKDPSVGYAGSQSQTYTGPMYAGASLVHGKIFGYKKARARVLDCIILDDTTETVYEQIMDPDGVPITSNGSPVIRQAIKAKYPRGRRIVGANGVILFDGMNPNPGGDFGILRVTLEPTLNRFWATGMVQQTAELQLAANKLLSSVVENAIRLNNGIIVATNDTGLDWESFAGIPAQIVQINRGSEFKIEYPPPMPADMIQAPHRMLDLQRRILGYPDTRSGVPGKGNVSAELTETEISQAQSVSRLRSKMLYYMVQRLAKMIFARMAFGYRTRRVIPAVEGESYKPVIWEPLENPEKYSLYVDPATFTVMSKTMLKRLGLSLYRLKAIDRKSLLEAIGWPDWEQTSERIDRAEAAAAMAKAAGKKK